MRLLLNENAPVKCDFLNFEETPDREMVFATAAGWSMNTAAMDKVHSSFHRYGGDTLFRDIGDLLNVTSTTMKVTHLQHPSVEDSVELDKVPAIPSELHYTVPIRGSEEATGTASTPRDDVGMKQMLRGMMEPEILTQGDTQAQSMAQNMSEVKIELLPATIIRIKTSRAQAHGDSFDQSDFEQHIVRCLCGHEQEEDDMVCCYFCTRWQHLHCCGYSGVQDPRLPKIHACLRCVLGESFDGLSTDQKTMALRRRAMSFALQSGLRTKTNFAKIMGNMLRTPYLLDYR
jgi:hypothetical protein